MTSPAPRRASLLVTALIAGGLAMMVSTCGRVSFIDDGQVGDGGFYLRSSSSTGGPSSSSSMTSSSMMGGSSGACMGVDRGPMPTFQVTAADVDDGFVQEWGARNCAACHVGAGAILAFVPVMPPDPAADKAATAASLTKYCKMVNMGDMATLTSTNLDRTHLICKLVPLNGSSTPTCAHTGTPPNNETLDAVRPLGGPCLTAATRYRDELMAWLDAGSGGKMCPDAGMASSSGGSDASMGPACPRPDLNDEFDQVYATAGELCLHCHSGGFVPEASCFDLSTKAIAHERFCAYARTSSEPLSQATYEQTFLYRATRDDQNLRLNCSTRIHEGHETFMAEGMDEAARAWYDAIFAAPETP